MQAKEPGAAQPPLRLYNTMGRRVESFEPLHPPEVLIYTCGPTVYHFTHIGNLRSFVTPDILRRVLEYNGYRVRQVKNITDVGHLREAGDDRMEEAARSEGSSPMQIADFYTSQYIDDEASLNILPPAARPRATEYVPQMIELTQELIDKGYAYAAGGNVYFDVAKFPTYGALSGNRSE
ncbi:MAG TPA: cysteine--tRNA ligase, partial [Chloroflexota bacterium]|nr:cysteine--tRNA ligase [Chloroflexota bacterium]